MAEPITDQALQEAYRALIRGSAGGHLAEADWDALASGSAQPEQRDRLFDHVLSCGECSVVWRGISALEKDAVDAHLVSPPVITPSASWRTYAAPLALAAAVILAITSVVLMRNGNGAQIQDSTINRGATVPDIAGASFNPATRAFSWTPLPGAQQYRISVFTRNGELSWSETVIDPSASWPSSTPPVAGAYTWRIEALGSHGVIARTRLIDVDIAR